MLQPRKTNTEEARKVELKEIQKEEQTCFWIFWN